MTTLYQGTSNTKTLMYQVLLVVVPLLIVGCQRGENRNTQKVKGAVTFDGDPIQNGSIALIPVEGTSGPSVGAKIQDGNFLIPQTQGPVPGEYLVQLYANKSTGRKVETEGDITDVGQMNDEIIQFLPEKYNQQSKLQIRVIKGGDNTFNLDLTTKD